MGMSPSNDLRANIRRRAWGRLALVIVVAALVCVAAYAAHLRWDVSEDRVFSLSTATRQVLAALDEPIMIRAYVTPGLPQPYGRLRRFLEDMLRVYHETGGGKVGFDIVDPEADANTAAALEAMGIPRVQVQAVENDRAEIKQGYLAVVVEYLDKREVIPIVQGEAGFEYLLTRRIKKITGKGRPKLGLVVENVSALQLNRLRDLIDDDYELVELKPSSTGIPDDIRALLVPGFSKAASDGLRYALDQFRLSGRGMLVFAGNADADLANGIAVRPVPAAANAWLKDLGLSIEPGLVMDEMAARISVNQRQGVFMFRSVVDYPFVPLVRRMHEGHIVTRALETVSLPFAAPLAFAGGQGEMLLASSASAAIQNGPPFDVNPLTPLGERMQGMHRQQIMLAAVLSGEATSAFAEPPAGNEHAGHLRRSDDTRVIVVASRSLIDDEFLEGDNLNFLLNCIDWLARDEALVMLRSKGVTQRPLTPLTAAEKAMWKGLWLIALPLLIIVFGLWHWRRLRRRGR